MTEDNVTPLRPGPAKRLLVIDDAALIRAYYRQTLEPMGFVVEEAFNGLEALEKALMAPFDLAIVDVNMPKMDGLSFVRKLRTTEEIACLPVLMTSTRDRDSDIAAARAAGVNLYLVKPVGEDDLRLFTSIMTGAEIP
ncbi:response regulator [Azospirillum halopraeferens]|uniref:response regulator n=1 Tax=Azospirillum halopraeferens TaxID=34010 RepID=UPI00048D9DBA|nr:response regulator [Azospirillum halopraeferens]